MSGSAEKCTMSHQQPTNAKPKVTIADRSLLWEGAIIEYEVPPDTIAREFNTSALSIRYLETCVNVVRGGVFIYIHLPDATELRGKKITAVASVHKKTLSNKREYLHVDLRPTEANVTHRLVITAKADEFRREVGWEVFETPSPLSGAIVFMSPGATFRSQTGRRLMTEIPSSWNEGSEKETKKSVADASLVRKLADKYKK